MDLRPDAEATSTPSGASTEANGEPSRHVPEPSRRIDTRFPEQFVDALSRQEVFNKHLFRPNTYLHKWWARRCGSTFRTILKQFAPSAEQADYYAAGGLEGLTVLDPMMGGGTTLHEAIRLGANVIGADIDPIPVLQARASLSRTRFPTLRAAFNRFLADLHADLHPYFQTRCPTCNAQTDIRYCLHGVRKRCGCGTVTQVEQYDLRQDKDTATRLDPYSGEVYTCQQPDHPPGTRRLMSKEDKRCPSCGQAYQELREVPFHARYELVAVVGECPTHGLFYRAPAPDDLDLLAAADEARGALDFGDVEDFLVHEGPKSGDLIRHHVSSYLDLFSSRQLLYLHSAIKHLREFTGLERLNLALLVSTSLEFNSMLCGYKGWYKNRPGAIRHTFALHAYSFQYTALENNPVNPAKSSGNLLQLFHDRIERGRRWAALPIERRIGPNGERTLVSIRGEDDAGEEADEQSDLSTEGGRFLVMQTDSRCLPLADDSVDMVVTDPPYFDSVQYADLASFFRVWLARLVPDAAQWRYDHAQTAVAKRGRDANHFMPALAGIFAECQRLLKRGTGRMVFTFHHWDCRAWSELTLALRNAGFRLTNAYVVFSEHPISVHIRNLRSIRHDCILVCADGNAPGGRSWAEPKEFKTADSEAFCRGCGEALGWLLDGEIGDEVVHAEWKRLLGTDRDRLGCRPTGGDCVSRSDDLLQRRKTAGRMTRTAIQTTRHEP